MLPMHALMRAAGQDGPPGGALPPLARQRMRRAEAASADCSALSPERAAAPFQRHSHYDVRPVGTEHERAMAAILVRRMYAWRGYQTDVGGQAASDAHRLTLAAWQGDEVVATLTLARDSPAGLLADALYSTEINSLRWPGRVVCEVSRLAVDPVFSTRNLLVELLRFAHRQGRERFAASDVVIEVNPRHIRYYQHLLGFRQIGGLRRCARVDAPAVLLHRALDDFAVSISRLPKRAALVNAA